MAHASRGEVLGPRTLCGGCSHKRAVTSPLVRVAFDAQIFLLQRQGGVSRYFTELITRLPGVVPPLEVSTPFRRVVNQHLLDALPDNRVRPARGPAQPYPQLLAAAMQHRSDAAVSLVHHTFYAPGFLHHYPGRPKVVTVHDMIPEVMGTRGRFGNPHLAIREYVRRADLLIFVSAHAEADLLSLYGVPSAHRVVVHHGVDSSFLGGGPSPRGFPGDYVLFVGKRDGYKDFATLLAAFSNARRELVGMHLVCVGGGPLTAAEVEAGHAAGLQKRLHQFSLPDSDMPGAYANAAAFAFPSRYEGFGLPVLEAMAAGTPAVLANTSSLPEVGGDAAAYFAPGDPDDLAARLVEVLTDSHLRADRVSRGRARAREFTWTRTAEQTAEAYRRLLSRG